MKKKELFKKSLVISAFVVFFILYFLVFGWPSFLFWGFTQHFLLTNDIPDIIPSGK